MCHISKKFIIIFSLIWKIIYFYKRNKYILSNIDVCKLNITNHKVYICFEILHIVNV